MKLKLLVLFVILVALVAACAPAPTPVPPTKAPEPTKAAATQPPAPAATQPPAPAATKAPEPTKAPEATKPAPTQPPATKPVTPVTLKIAWMGSDYKTYKTWKDTFEKENPGVTIEYQLIPYADGPTVFNTMIQGGNTPDLAYLFMGMIAEYAERKAIQPLDDFMKPEDRAGWVPGALEAAQYKGKTYGVPLIGANRTLFVRTDLMKAAGYNEPPKTWVGHQ